MTDEQLIRTYLQVRNVTGTARVLNVPPHRVGNRLRKLRKAGVAVPSFGYTAITPEQVAGLNALLETLK